MRDMKIYAILFISILSGAGSAAQEIRLNLYGNYVFDDQVDSYIDPYNYFKGTIAGGLLWGASIEYHVHDYGIELLYLRQDTEVPVLFYDAGTFDEKQVTLDLGINWIMLGGMRSILPDDKLEPIAGFMMGVAVIDGKNPETQSSASAIKFAWGMRLGANFWINNKLGVRIQSQLLCATQAAGGSLYFSTGGATAGVTAYSSMLQFSLGGGLVFKLHNEGTAPSGKKK
jgi:hypothetical protein